MFLQKIRGLAKDWNKDVQDLDAVAKESLLYGMRLHRTPSRLKKELRRVGIHTLLARPLWAGNAYLLITLPEVIHDRKRKIPNLEDLLYARSVLEEKHCGILSERVEKKCQISTEELLRRLKPAIRLHARKGRFLVQFDQMHGTLHDIEQDITSLALEVINREISNFRTQNIDEIIPYLAYCVGKKAKTYLRKEAPKQKKVQTEASHFDYLVHKNRDEEENSTTGFEEVDFREDLRRILSSEVYAGISLLMNFADEEIRQQFRSFLKAKQIKLEWLTNSQLKLHIERFLGCRVFEKAKANQEFRNFLLQRARSPEGSLNIESFIGAA